MECTPASNWEEDFQRFLRVLDSGPLESITALSGLQSFQGPFFWKKIMEMLCTEKPSSEESDGKLTLKPALLLLPVNLQRNIFRFLNLSISLVPHNCVRLLVKTVNAKKGYVDAWLLTLSRMLLAETKIQKSPSSQLIMKPLQSLCHFGNERPKLGWLKQDARTTKRTWTEDLDESPLKRKEEGPYINKLCLEIPIMENETPSTACNKQKVKTSVKAERTLQVPETIKLHITRLRELFHVEGESLQSWDDTFHVDLKELCQSCNPEQLQCILSSLGVEQLSSQSLLQFCCQLHSMSPDLSFSQSLVLANLLFRKKVLSLTLSASRPLLAALSMFCMKYARSACNILIEPLLQAETGSLQIDFVCRMMTECLQLEQLSLCFGPILKVPLCEGSLSVLYILLEKQAVISCSEFELLLISLCQSADNLSKSVLFSKLLMAIMRKNQSLILPSHLVLLSNAIHCNQTFLKKSLQGAFKRLQQNIT
ncbi:Fanconi anemia group E protein isoform X2 [Xenopus laevis]|uniref:Fanconi anemia group E protein isoform X2 n=1 Tax=Xenopus laevis TaxID=8355 RepID=A0A8J1M8I6_XENLA|nr:Fanconi anemia group E protein isoform X2 [Xenopus laevis]